MIVALALLLVAVGTVAFHFLSPWWWTPIASNWGYIDDTIILTFWITGVVFVIVVLFMAYCVLRFRFRPEARAEYNPENKKLEWWLTILTALGVAGMLIPGLFVWNQFVTVPDGADEFEVMAKQWDWSFRMPGKDGKLGTTNVRLINDENPFGIDPKDPNGQDDVLVEGENLHLPLDRPVKVLLRSLDVLHDFYVPEFRVPGKDGKLGTTNVRLINDENPFGIDPKDPNGQDDVLVEGENLHLPLDRPVKVLLRSLDVLHDFYVPEFRAKMDMVPGSVTYFWLTPTRTGTFDILCFELCGVGHYAMRSQVVVESQSAYDAWLKEQTTFKKSMAAAGNGAEEADKLVSRQPQADIVNTGSAQ